MPSISTPVRYQFAQFAQHQSLPTGAVTIDANSHSDRILCTGTQRTDYLANRDYKILLAKRMDATNNYFRSGYTWSAGTAEYFGRLNTGVDYNCLDRIQLIDGPGSFPSTDAALANLASQALKRKLKKQVNQFNSLVPLAEIRDLHTTVRSMVQLTTRLVGTLADIKRTRGRSAFQYASKAWLTYGFGIRPALADIQALNSSISSYLLREDRGVKLTGSAKRDWVSDYSTSVTGGRLGTANVKLNCYHTLSYRYLGYFNLPLKSANNYGVNEHFGLDLPKLAPAIWEATAFSWVIDYFTNVGDLIEDTFVSPPGQTVYLILNRKYTCHMQGSCYHVINAVHPHTQRPGAINIDYFEFDRTKQIALPRTGFRFRSVDEVAKYGVSKLLNLTSILAGKGR